MLVTGDGADFCGAGALTSRSTSGAGAADRAGADWALELLTVTHCACGDCGAGGTNVGSGARVIESAGACAWGAAGCGAGCTSVALSSAQPPNVAATEAAVINTFIPGALVVGL